MAEIKLDPNHIHSDSIELSVFSCWTGRRLLLAKVVKAEIDPKGKFISIDIDNDESAKPIFESSANQPDILSRLREQVEAIPDDAWAREGWLKAAVVRKSDVIAAISTQSKGEP